MLTTGLEYLRGGGAGGGNTVSARAAVELQLPGGHAVRAGYYDRGTGYELIISLGGPLIAPRPRMHATGSTTSVLVFPGRIAGRLYRDVNRDGRYDEGADTPLAGARLLLDGATVSVTNADGAYRYDHVPPGAHSIGVDLTSVSALLSPAGELRRSLHVAAKVDYVADFAFVQTGGIGGVVFLDEDGDGLRGENEPPVPDVRVICSCGTDTLTTVDGTFVIGDLLPGAIGIALSPIPIAATGQLHTNSSIG